MKLCTRIINVNNGVQSAILPWWVVFSGISLLSLQIFGLSLKGGFNGCGHEFGEGDGLGGLGGLAGHGGRIRRIV